MLLASAASPLALIEKLGLNVALRIGRIVGLWTALATLRTVWPRVVAGLRLAHLAGQRAVLKHVAGVAVALADSCPGRTVRIGILTSSYLLGLRFGAVANVTARAAVDAHVLDVLEALPSSSPGLT